MTIFPHPPKGPGNPRPPMYWKGGTLSPGSRELGKGRRGLSEAGTDSKAQTIKLNDS